MNCIIPVALDGQRLDRAIAILTGLPRTTVKNLLEAQAVTCDGEPSNTPAKRVSTGQEITIDAEQFHAATANKDAEEIPQPNPDIAVEVVYADEQIVVVDKPAGLVTHPGAGHINDTLLNGLLHKFPDAATAGPPDRPAVVHRLDRDTSGLLVCARTADAHQFLVQQLAEHKTKREYVTFVRGTPAAQQGTIDAPIGRSHRSRTKMQIRPDGRPALTDYTVLASAVCQRLNPPKATLLRCQLQTGRTHQIRVHLASINLAVLGDMTYGCADPFGGTRQLLHAVKLSLEHPSTGENMTFVSDPPADLVAVAQALGLAEQLAAVTQSGPA